MEMKSHFCPLSQADSETGPFVVSGPIPSFLIADTARIMAEEGINGAVAFFTGWVRQDPTNEKHILAIEYMIYIPMLEKVVHNMIEEARKEGYSLHIYHSIGIVPAGECSMAVFLASPHRNNIFECLALVVEKAKKVLPVWKKEIYSDGSYRWVEGIAPASETFRTGRSR